MKILFLFIIIFYSVFCQDETTPEDTTIDEDTTTIETTTAIPIFSLTDDNEAVRWSPQSTATVIIEAPPGFKISVNVTECNIDGENGENAVITTEGNTDGLLFTYGVSRRPAYLFNNNILYGTFTGTNASNFTVVFTRIGEELTTTTTEIPTSTIILPTPDYNDSSTLLVYIAGRSANDYWTAPDLLDLLKRAIGNMAAYYCRNENFPLNGSITSDNVIVNHLRSCWQGWPQSGTCIQLNFSVPVNLIEGAESRWGGYQLTTKHLRIMWRRLASEYLPEGSSVYHPPDEGRFKWGILILIVGTLLFALLLLAIRHYGIKVSKRMRRRKLSDTTSIISTSDRNSQVSLPPHYLQDTPQLFENAYPMYNPDRNTEYSEPTYGRSFEYSGYQNLGADLDEDKTEQRDVEESGA